MTLSNNSVVAITGAGSGIGRALAVRLAGNGSRVSQFPTSTKVDCTKPERLAQDLGIPISTHAVDVAKPEEVQSFANETIEHHGRVTHLINNAGVGLIGSFEQISLEDFHWLMEINFWGVVNCCKFFLPILRHRKELML